MASLQELKKRKNGVLAAKQLAGAMKTVSSIKFTRINNVLSGYGKYSDFCARLTDKTGTNAKTPAKPGQAPPLYVLASGNRGLCGGCNSELFAYFDETVKNAAPDTLYIACGKKAVEHCGAKGIKLYAEFDLPDVPAFEDCSKIADALCKIYENGEAGEIYFICQHHINLLKRQPQTVRFLPAGEKRGEEKEEKIIFIPDKATVKERLYRFYLDTFVYSLLLNSAAGVQAATLSAMRSAYDTACESANNLETQINRRRQAQVTAGVLETAAENTDNNNNISEV